MDWPIAVVIMVAIGAFVKIMTARYQAMNGIVEDERGNQTLVPKANDGESQREVKELRERVKVLERIATSDRETKQISSEIEALRNEPN